MAAEIDPESEALVRQLHRELNGLTRTSRRGGAPHPSSDSRLPPHPRDKETRSEGAGGGGGKRSRQDRERDGEGGRSGGEHRRRSPPHGGHGQGQQRQRRVQGLDDSSTEEGNGSDRDVGTHPRRGGEAGGGGRGGGQAGEEEEYESTHTTATRSGSGTQSGSGAPPPPKRHKAGTVHVCTGTWMTAETRVRRERARVQRPGATLGIRRGTLLYTLRCKAWVPGVRDGDEDGAASGVQRPACTCELLGAG